jgi:hypothetical protein
MAVVAIADKYDNPAAIVLLGYGKDTQHGADRDQA